MTAPAIVAAANLPNCLRGYGLRVQLSVFECELRADQMQQLRQRLERLIVAELDSVRFWRVPEQGCAQRLHLGRTAPSPEWEDLLI